MSIKNYLLTGVIVYIVLAITRRHTFKNADKASIARGLLFALLLWPVGLLAIAFDKLNPRL